MLHLMQKLTQCVEFLKILFWDNFLEWVLDVLIFYWTLKNANLELSYRLDLGQKWDWLELSLALLEPLLLEVQLELLGFRLKLQFMENGHPLVE
jgi:hypothetical protein